MSCCKKKSFSFRRWIFSLLCILVLISVASMLDFLRKNHQDITKSFKRQHVENSNSPSINLLITHQRNHISSIKLDSKSQRFEKLKAQPQINISKKNLILKNEKESFKQVEEFQRNALYIPSVYRNDPVAFRKYVEYLHQTEDPLPLQTRAVVILTNYRSGSSFFGELFNQHPDVFYVFEPLIIVSAMDGCNSNVQLKMQMVEQLSQCVIPDWKNIYERLDRASRPKMTRNTFVCIKKKFCFAPFTKDLNNEEHCPRSNNTKTVHDSWRDCGMVNINVASNVCRRKKMVAIKLIRFCDIYDLKDIVTKLHVDLKIVHLIRDPRGIANSRRSLHKRLSLPDAMKFTCTKQANNANVGLFVKPDWLEGRYKMFRYEDAAINPIETTLALYEFVGLELKQSVKEWIIKNTHQNITTRSQFATDNAANRGDRHNYKSAKRNRMDGFQHDADMRNPWSHHRDSKSVVQKWKKYLSYSQAKSIESECDEIMKLAGYIPVSNANEYKNSTRQYFL